jgi:hypothetical protein
VIVVKLIMMLVVFDAVEDLGEERHDNSVGPNPAPGPPQIGRP